MHSTADDTPKARAVMVISIQETNVIRRHRNPGLKNYTVSPDISADNNVTWNVIWKLNGRAILKPQHLEESWLGDNADAVFTGLSPLA